MSRELFVIMRPGDDGEPLFLITPARHERRRATMALWTTDLMEADTFTSERAALATIKIFCVGWINQWRRAVRVVDRWDKEFDVYGTSLTHERADHDGT